MSRKNEQYFSTSEFAAICGVTKYTLFHYDELGILKPEAVNDNGYRFYSVDQFFIFDIISILKEIGTPLKEIKQFIDYQSTEQFLQMLMEKGKQLSDEQKKLIRMQKLLNNTIHMTNYAMHVTYGQPRIEFCEEENLMAVSLPQNSDKKRLQKISELYKYCASQYLLEGLPTGVIIEKGTLEKGLNGLFERSDSFFCKVSLKKENKFLHKKPKGQYAVIDHKDCYENIADSYQKLIDYIAEKHFVITGNAYEFYITIGNPEKYITEIMIQID